MNNFKIYRYDTFNKAVDLERKAVLGNSLEAQETFELLSLTLFEEFANCHKFISQSQEEFQQCQLVLLTLYDTLRLNSKAKQLLRLSFLISQSSFNAFKLSVAIQALRRALRDEVIKL